MLLPLSSSLSCSLFWMLWLVSVLSGIWYGVYVVWGCVSCVLWYVLCVRCMCKCGVSDVCVGVCMCVWYVYVVCVCGVCVCTLACAKQSALTVSVKWKEMQWIILLLQGNNPEPQGLVAVTFLHFHRSLCPEVMKLSEGAILCCLNSKRIRRQTVQQVLCAFCTMVIVLWQRRLSWLLWLLDHGSLSEQSLPHLC